MQNRNCKCWSICIKLSLINLIKEEWKQESFRISREKEERQLLENLSNEKYEDRMYEPKALVKWKCQH